VRMCMRACERESTRARARARAHKIERENEMTREFPKSLADLSDIPINMTRRYFLVNFFQMFVLLFHDRFEIRTCDDLASVEKRNATCSRLVDLLDCYFQSLRRLCVC